MAKWITTPDEQIRHIWECHNDECKKPSRVSVPPSYYADSGTPICKKCDEDMSYIRTEVRQ